jgi:hypothetical protein
LEKFNAQGVLAAAGVWASGITPFPWPSVQYSVASASFSVGNRFWVFILLAHVNPGI